MFRDFQIFALVISASFLHSQGEVLVPLTERYAEDIIKICEAMDAPCSEVGLNLFKKVEDNKAVYLEYNANINEMQVGYKTKCTYTFLANLFPLWSHEESKNSLIDWTNIADSWIKEYKGTNLQRRAFDMSFVHDYQDLLNPKLNTDFEKKLLFQDGESSESSNSSISRKVLAAQDAFNNPCIGYCWPMQSETFVKTNRLMELFLLAFYNGDSGLKNQLFKSSFLNRSFNLYSICKSLQKDALVDTISASLADPFKSIAELPMNDISLEEANFASGYMRSLVKTTKDCKPSTLISFTATEESIGYAENVQLKNYLQHETDFVKNYIMLKFYSDAIPIERYSVWLMRYDCDISVLMRSVYKVAKRMGIIQLLKLGNVGQVSSLLSNQETHLQILKQMSDSSKPMILSGLSDRSFEASLDNFEKICADLNTVYTNSNQYPDGMSYLIHHYPQHKMIVQMLDEDNSEAFKYYLTSLVCKSLLSASSSR